MKEAGITLPDILNARDRREQFRKKLLSSRTDILVQLGVNSPGGIKNSNRIRHIFNEGIKQLSLSFGNSILEEYINSDLPTGPEAFYKLKLKPESAKEKCIAIENVHILGRLWDMDVYRHTGIPVSRGELSLPPRGCFICNDSAHNCTRSSRHTKVELEKHILRIYKSFKDGNFKSGLK